MMVAAVDAADEVRESSTNDLVSNQRPTFLCKPPPCQSSEAKLKQALTTRTTELWWDAGDRGQFKLEWATGESGASLVDGRSTGQRLDP
ncbi:hypothetical protein CORC01_11687 [Colletotrichum orchidophilum]|uniref:Uncharacterized protein n=1 Tax=Colletotrichum orchidophilum TaxID=1209926 RepID=A0A1G4AV65_9PEZI|nr:uncharacterized protein CORC01_11687 [Colletotrichum orchidophilum]OHE93048.1 hypothetical protein CORC01_11687 [Colletotrichum orchidophilum]